MTNGDIDQRYIPRVRSAPPHRSPGWALTAGVWALVFMLVWSVARSTQPTPLHDPKAEPRVAVPRGDLASEELAVIDIFREASPAVVYVTNIELGRDFFGFNVFEIPRGAGTGFIYDRDGHIVTNVHVIQGASRLTVTLADESQWPARVVGYEADKDLAVLKIDAPPDRLKPIKVGTSHDLQVGQTVLAIGNPFGFDHTLTVGVVSALGREIEAITGRKIRDVVQTDAAINPGNSGGPLLDSAGRLIGINTQIASPSGVSSGIGFAVPVDIINEIVPDIIRYGSWRRPGLGVVLFPDWVARRLRIPGLLIDSVADGGGAAQSGLRGSVLDASGRIRRVGDIILKIDESEVNTLHELKDALESHNVDDEVSVTFVRDDETRVELVKLQYVN